MKKKLEAKLSNQFSIHSLNPMAKLHDLCSEGVWTVTLLPPAPGGSIDWSRGGLERGARMGELMLRNG